jgi:Outer membrane protein beta-barrel domain
MIKIITLLLSLTIAGTTLAQQSVEVRIAGGAGFPTSNFASYNGHSLGYAQQGWVGGIELGYSLRKNWSLSFSVDYGLNGTDATQIAHEYLHANPAYLKAEVKSGSYQTLSAFAGLEPRINLTPKLYLQGQVAIGISNVEGPNNTAHISFSSPFEEKTVAGSSNALAYKGKISLKYDLSDKLGIGVFGGYFGTNPTFTIVDAATDNHYTVEQKVGVLTSGIQLSFKL